MLFVGGQIGIVDGSTVDGPVAGSLAEGGFQAQATQVLANLRTQVEANGATLDNLAAVAIAEVP